MKKLSIFAVALAALAFTACGGNKSAKTEDTDSVKTFEQEQVEAKIKMELDSLAAELGKLKDLPIVKEDGGVKLTDQEKQVKPDYLLSAAVAEKAATLAEKYRMISALSVDKTIAALYEMPTDEYQAAVAKLIADVDDPSFKDISDTASIFKTGQELYTAMEQNGRINNYWQMVAASLVEEIFAMSQNSDKFLKAFDDDAAANVTYRIVLLSDAVSRLTEYDPEFEPIAKAIEALTPLNAVSVDQLKTQLAEAKDKIVEARNNLIK